MKNEVLLKKNTNQPDKLLFLFVINIDAFYSRSNSSQNLVGNRAATGSKFRWRETVTEDGNEIAFFAWNVGDINHADIHTYVANIFRFSPVDKTEPPPVA